MDIEVDMDMDSDVAASMNLGAPFSGVLERRALLFGVCIQAL